MRKATEYRARAAECRSLAGRTPPGDQRDQLLQMARAWDALAEERDRLTRREAEKAQVASSREGDRFRREE